MHANQYNYDIGFRVRCKDKAPIRRQLKTFSILILYMLNNPTPSYGQKSLVKKYKKNFEPIGWAEVIALKVVLAVNGFESSLKTVFLLI